MKWWEVPGIQSFNQLASEALPQPAAMSSDFLFFSRLPEPSTRSLSECTVFLNSVRLASLASIPSTACVGKTLKVLQLSQSTGIESSQEWMPGMNSGNDQAHFVRIKTPAMMRHEIGRKYDQMRTDPTDE
jgi:hypothetical protein